MKKIPQIIVFGIVISCFGAAQSSPFAPELATRQVELMERQFMMEALENGRIQAEADRDEQARARAQEYQMILKMNRIAELWKRFVEEYTSKRSFNIRTAKDLSKAFQELERSGCWPKPDREK